MKSVLSRNYRQLVFQLLELNLSCNWVTIFKLFNLYESENIIGDFINEEYIVNENLYQQIVDGIDEMNKSIKPKTSKYIKQLIRDISKKNSSNGLLINSKGDYKHFKIKKLDKGNLEDFMMIRNNPQKFKDNIKVLYHIKFVGGNYYSLDWELNRKEKPTIEKINMFFEYQTMIMSNLSNWIEIGLKWDRNKSKFKELKTKDYNKFLIEMDIRLYLSGYYSENSNKKKIVGKGVFSGYWKWNDYDKLKIRRKTKEHTSTIEGFMIWFQNR
tara:strand:+ start:423 stop:1232 length:810 start_codon:yes stop_codon:yes gene_type:complete